MGLDLTVMPGRQDIEHLLPVRIDDDELVVGTSPLMDEAGLVHREVANALAVHLSLAEFGPVEGSNHGGGRCPIKAGDP